MDKDFKTIEEQIEILKTRGILINDERAKEILTENTYYYLINGYKDLFSIIIILKILLKESEFKKFYTILINDLEELKENIKSIEFSQILNKMGFPERYKELLNM